MHWSADASSDEVGTSYIAKDSCLQDEDSPLEMNESSLHVHCKRYQGKMI